MAEARTIYVKPKPGARVRRPERDGRIIPPEGAEVPRSKFYLRRLRDGDLAPAAKPRAKAKAGESKE